MELFLLRFKINKAPWQVDAGRIQQRPDVSRFRKRVGSPTSGQTQKPSIIQNINHTTRGLTRIIHPRKE